MNKLFSSLLCFITCLNAFAAAPSSYDDNWKPSISGGDILIIVIIGAIVIGIIAVLWLLVVYLWKKNKQLK
jgi:hypothetical protein